MFLETFRAYGAAGSGIAGQSCRASRSCQALPACPAGHLDRIGHRPPALPGISGVARLPCRTPQALLRCHAGPTDLGPFICFMFLETFRAYGATGSGRAGNATMII